MGRVMGSVMTRKALFLVVVALWLSSRAVAVPSAAGGIDRYCQDGICDTHTCRPGYPESHGDGCEETSSNCPWDCEDPYDPCEHPNPIWVSDGGTVQIVGAYSYTYWGAPQLYCQWGTTRTVVQHDEQACVSARQPDRTICYQIEDPYDRLYEPNQFQCCSYWWCGGTGASCP
jgi:hypothetical protein